MAQPHLSSRTFVRNLLANWVGLVAEVVVAFALTPFIIKSLGLTAYGLWGFLNSLVGYMGLVDMGIRGGVGRYFNYHLARTEGKQANEVLATSLCFLSLMSLLALLIAIGIALGFATLFPRVPADMLNDARIVLPFMVFGLWFSFTSSILRIVCAACERFDLVNGVALIMLAIRVVGTVAVLMLGFGFSGLVVVTLSSYGLATLGYYFLARHLWPQLRFNRAAVRWSRFKELWGFSMAAFAGRSAATLAAQAGPLLAMIFSGPKAVGIYNIAQLLIQSGQRLTEQFGATLYPSIMKLGGGPDYPGLRKMFTWYVKSYAILASLVFFGIMAFADPFIALWVEPGMQDVGIVSALLSGAELMHVYAGTAAFSLLALGRARMTMVIAMAHALAIVLFSMLGLWWFNGSLIGLASGILCAAALAHGLAYPLTALHEMQVPIPQRWQHYIYTTLRLSALAAIAFILFWAAQHGFGTMTWWSLGSAIALSSIGYLLLATLTLGSDLKPAWLKLRAWIVRR